MLLQLTNFMVVRQMITGNIFGTLWKTWHQYTLIFTERTRKIVEM